MDGNCTFFSFILASVFFLFGGQGPEKAEGQSSCGMTVSHWEVILEVNKNDTLYKKVKVKIDNPNPGLMKEFFYLLDDEPYQGPGQHSSFDYQYSWEILIPIETEKITFGDLNSPTSCTVSKIPDFEPESCKIKIDHNIVMLDDCQSYMNLTVADGQTIESAYWIRYGTTDTVHRELNWDEIPMGHYEIYVTSTDGCEYDTEFSHCTERSNAGNDQTAVYCLGQEEPLNMWDLLASDVDIGDFFTLDGERLDADEMTEMDFDAVQTISFEYITHVEYEIPDTSSITIHVTDCNSCDYEITSSFRSCLNPDSVEITILPLNPEISEFEITLPDGNSHSALPDETFHIYWPDTEDKLQLEISGQTSAVACDTIIPIGPFPMNNIETDLHEIEISSEDSAMISFRILSGGIAPYEVRISSGEDLDTSFTMQDHEVFQKMFYKTSDDVLVSITDHGGCTQIETITLDSDCALPEVESIPTTCGDSNGRVALDMGPLSEKCKIQWAEGDRSSNNRWNRTDLAPGIYHYTISYDDCIIRDSVEILKSTASFPEIQTEKGCLLDERVRFYIPDSLEINQWIYKEESLPSFSVDLPANVHHSFTLETMDGCRKTLEIIANESPWLEELTFSKPNKVSAIPGKDQQSLTEFGWYFRNEELCASCFDYSNGLMLEEGVYGFFIEQDEDCRRDTLFRVQQDDRYFQIPNVLTPNKTTNNRLQIFDPMQQMESIIELSIYDRYGNILYKEENTFPDDDQSLDWPRSSGSTLPNMVICVASIRCTDGKEINISQDILILR